MNAADRVDRRIQPLVNSAFRAAAILPRIGFRLLEQPQFLVENIKEGPYRGDTVLQFVAPLGEFLQRRRGRDVAGVDAEARWVVDKIPYQRHLVLALAHLLGSGRDERADV